MKISIKNNIMKISIMKNNIMKNNIKNNIMKNNIKNNIMKNSIMKINIKNNKLMIWMTLVTSNQRKWETRCYPINSINYNNYLLILFNLFHQYCLILLKYINLQQFSLQLLLNKLQKILHNLITYLLINLYKMRKDKI